MAFAVRWPRMLWLVSLSFNIYSGFSYLMSTIVVFDILVLVYSHVCSFVLKLSFAIQVTCCEHVFCKACLIDYTTSDGGAVCPKCSKLLTVDLSSSNSNESAKTSVRGYRAASILNRIQLDDFQTSTKIDALVCCMCF